MNTIVKLLKTAKSYIRKGWTQGPFAVNKDGDGTSPTSRTACKWCAAGAMWRAASDLKIEQESRQYQHARDLLDRVVPASSINSLIMYNETDRRTKKQILAVYDKAIARAQPKTRRAATSRATP